jgi:hypothetical protein
MVYATGKIDTCNKRDKSEMLQQWSGNGVRGHENYAIITHPIRQSTFSETGLWKVKILEMQD